MRSEKTINIPTYLISAYFRHNQIFFRWYGKWFRQILCKFTHIFVQNKLSKQILEYAGLYDVTVSGDTRFDRVIEIARQSKEIEAVEEFKQDDIIIIGGSTWHKDEELLTRFINGTSHNVKYIIVPHIINEGNIRHLERSIKKPLVKYSSADDNDISKFRVLIIDNIGMLSSLYKYADIAYIGGGFGAGIHNILEAAVFGLPVIFGPRHKKYQEALDLLKLGGAYTICDCENLKKYFEDLLDPRLRKRAGEISEKYVAEKQGATKIILDKIM
jgi:3-deoxy-D-manno-octulosonic-acid transferase